MEKPVLKLEASAGSGKTFRLALEYLARLLGAFAGRAKPAAAGADERQRLGSILAITFTVKAAQEMKARIVSKLKRFALSAGGGALGDEDREFLRRLAGQTGLSRERIVALAAELIEMILADYDDFNVMTIDSLMSAMVKVVAPDLELAADYEIAVDARDELESRGRRLLAGLADNDWPRLEAFLEDFSRLNASQGWQADAAITAKVADLFRRTLRQGEAGTNEPPSGLRQRAESRWRELVEALRPLERVMREEAGERGRSRFLNGTYATNRLMSALDEALAKGDGFRGLDTLVAASFFRKPGSDVLLVKGAPDGYRQRFASAYAPARQALGAMALAYSAFKTLPYREFLGDFAAAWNAGKEKVFVEEFSRVLSRLFDSWAQEAFPYLYLKLSDRFRNFLFDEFQDTSTLQFKALAPLIDEVLSRDRRASLFVVGDRKQAIYRWRGGNSELMEEERLRREIPAIGHLSPAAFSETLDGNWRSRLEIVRFNNEFWEPQAIAAIAAEADLQQAIRDNFAASAQKLPDGEKRQGGYVEITLRAEPQAGDAEGGEEAAAEEDGNGALSPSHLDAIEGIIRRLTGEHGYAASDIAVLLRKNDQVRAVVRHLGRRGIGSLSDQSLLLSSNPRVNEIIAFLRFLDYPPDDLNFFAFVGGDLLRRAAEQRFPGEAAGFSEEAFLGGQGPLYKSFQERFPGCWQGLIEPFFQSVGFLPPYDVFSDITQAFRAYENFPGDTPFLMALGDALHHAERDGGSSIAGFLRRWEKMVADEETPAVALPENAPGVRVLTMHQSKGLEFPAVIVPLDDHGGRQDANPYLDEEGMFHITAASAPAHPALGEKFRRENVRASMDLLNLLYVAFTRAREALFVPVAAAAAIQPAAPARDGLTRRITRASDVVGRHPLLAWRELPGGRCFVRGALARRRAAAGAPAGASPAAIPSKRIPTRSWHSRYLVFRRSEIGKRRERSGAGRGERIHDLLARLGAVRDARGLEARIAELAAAAGLPAADREAVLAFLRRDDVLRLLARGAACHSEKEIVDMEGGAPELRRLDRLQVGRDEVLVIDFKTGPEKSEAHMSQIRRYLGAVGPLFPGRQCRGFLLYIDRGEVEEVPCSS